MHAAPSQVTDPLPVGGCVTSKVRGSPSGWVAGSVKLTSTPSSVVRTAVAASGGSLTGLTVAVTVAKAVPPFPSEMRITKSSVPWKPACGRYVHVSPLQGTVPWRGARDGLAVSVSPSGSAPSSTKGTATSSSVAIVVSDTVGGRLTTL